MNTEDFVTYEQALKLKELGFREDCLYLYMPNGRLLDKHKTNSNDVGVNDLYSSHNKLLFQKGVNTELCDAPTLWDVQKWLRKHHKFIISYEPRFYKNKMPLMGYSYSLYEEEKGMFSYKLSDDAYNSPEEALSAGITECLKLLEINK